MAGTRPKESHVDAFCFLFLFLRFLLCFLLCFPPASAIVCCASDPTVYGLDGPPIDEIEARNCDKYRTIVNYFNESVGVVQLDCDFCVFSFNASNHARPFGQSCVKSDLIRDFSHLFGGKGSCGYAPVTSDEDAIVRCACAEDKCNVMGRMMRIGRDVWPIVKSEKISICKSGEVNIATYDPYNEDNAKLIRRCAKNTEVNPKNWKQDHCVATYTVETMKGSLEGELDTLETELDIEETELDIGETELDIGETELDSGETELDLGETELDLGETELDSGETELSTIDFELAKNLRNKLDVQVRCYTNSDNVIDEWSVRFPIRKWAYLNPTTTPVTTTTTTTMANTTVAPENGVATVAAFKWIGVLAAASVLVMMA